MTPPDATFLSEFPFNIYVFNNYMYSKGCLLTTKYFSLFLDIKKYGVDLVCSVPGQLKNIFEQILSQESMRRGSIFQAVLG
jgi:hypothetical protein